LRHHVQHRFLAVRHIELLTVCNRLRARADLLRRADFLLHQRLRFVLCSVWRWRHVRTGCWWWCC
jgi:hypothetical protein